MSEVFNQSGIGLYNGDALELIQQLPDNSVDAVVTDPPYGLGFNGNKWDKSLPLGVIWAQCLRVLKPGGHLVAFTATRTQHRMACAVEDAGFEIRDMLAWLRTKGFPKSTNVAAAIDRAAGVTERPLKPAFGMGTGSAAYNTVPVTADAIKWDGWGSGLRPSLEPITLARKPFTGVLYKNVLEHGTGALNIRMCKQAVPGSPAAAGGAAVTAENEYDCRWPANVCVADDLTSSAVFGTDPVKQYKPAVMSLRTPSLNLFSGLAEAIVVRYSDLGGDRSRFFNRFEWSDLDFEVPDPVRFHCCGLVSGAERRIGFSAERKNTHDTVKPISLMRWLVRLVTPPAGLVLDPFTGSGTTGVACIEEGFNFTGFELDPEYAQIALTRLQHHLSERQAKCPPKSQ